MPKDTNLEKPVISLLLVEDNALTQKMYPKQLDKVAAIHGFAFTIDIAKDGKEAIDKTLQKKYDVIIMDNEMPVVTGTMACPAIVNNENNLNQSTPIITNSDSTNNQPLTGSIHVFSTKNPNADSLNKDEKFQTIINKILDSQKLEKELAIKNKEIEEHDAKVSAKQDKKITFFEPAGTVQTETKPASESKEEAESNIKPE